MALSTAVPTQAAQRVRYQYSKLSQVINVLQLETKKKSALDENFSRYAQFVIKS